MKIGDYGVLAIGIFLALFGLYMGIKDIFKNKEFIFKFGRLNEEIKLFLFNPAMKYSVKISIRLVVIMLLAVLLGSFICR